MKSNDPAWWTPGRRHYVLFVLCLVGIFNMIDRQIITILLEPIKHELGVSDTKMGLLSGIAFAAFYVVAGIPLARFADRGSRRALISTCLVVWSASTALCGFVHSFVQLALARVGVASGEAGAYPASQSMLADLYKASQRGTVIGVLQGAQSLGIALGLIAAGWLSQHFGWRVAFISVGLPGIVLAVVLWLTVAEPPRGMSDARPNTDATPTLRDVFRFFIGSPPMMMILLVAIGCAFSGYSLLGWAPTFFIRIYGMTTGEVGALLGPAMAGGLFIGNIAAGRVADHLAKGDLSVYAIVAGAGSLLAIPFGIWFAFAPTSGFALTAVFIANLLLTCWLPPTYAVALGLAPPRMRAMVTAVISLCMTLFGIGMGPMFIGAMNDLLAPAYGQDSIRYSLAFSLAGLVLGGVTSLLIARRLRRQRG